MFTRICTEHFSHHSRGTFMQGYYDWIIFDGRMVIVHSSPEGLQRDGKAEVSPWGFMIQVCVMCPLNKAFHPEGGKKKKIQNGVKTFPQKRYITFFLVFLFSQVSGFLTYAFHHQWNRLLFSEYLFSRRLVIPVAKKNKVPSSYLHWPRNTAHCFLELDLSLAMEYQTWQIHTFSQSQPELLW